MTDTVIMIFNILKRNEIKDIEVPLSITANDLVLALNQAYRLGIDTSDIKNCYLKAENPVALIRGNKTLYELGLRDGTELYFDR